LIRREEMGRGELDRTKRFTDDGKLRGIISSAKFVPEVPLEEESKGFGRLFRVKGRKDEEIERELNVDDDEKVVKKRKLGGVRFAGSPAFSVEVNKDVTHEEGAKDTRKRAVMFIET